MNVRTYQYSSLMLRQRVHTPILFDIRISKLMFSCRSSYSFNSSLSNFHVSHMATRVVRSYEKKRSDGFILFTSAEHAHFEEIDNHFSYLHHVGINESKTTMKPSLLFKASACEIAEFHLWFLSKAIDIFSCVRWHSLIWFSTIGYSIFASLQIDGINKIKSRDVDVLARSAASYFFRISLSANFWSGAKEV